MKLYRCITQDQYNLLKEGIIYFENSTPDYGKNDFEYDDGKYLHFFIYPECANYYRNINKKYDYVVTINIPDTIDYEIGFGEYKIGLIDNLNIYGDVIKSGVLDGKIIPFPEVKISSKCISLELIDNIGYYAQDIGDGDNYFYCISKLIHNKCLEGTEDDYEYLLEEVEFLASDIKKTK